MMAFNLGIFFRNLKGEEVYFSAKNHHCEVQFIGGVENLNEQTDLTHHLSVTLSKGELSCRIAFEEVEDEDSMENTQVEIRFVQELDGEETLLLQTTFLYEEITIKPATGDSDDPDDGPLSA